MRQPLALIHVWLEHAKQIKADTDPDTIPAHAKLIYHQQHNLVSTERSVHDYIGKTKLCTVLINFMAKITQVHTHVHVCLKEAVFLPALGTN